MVGKNRKVNNTSRIQRTTNAIGAKIEKYRAEHLSKEQPKAARELSVVVDGGYIHDRDNPGHNFEAMAAKVYKPENVVSISKGKSIIKALRLSRLRRQLSNSQPSFFELSYA